MLSRGSGAWRGISICDACEEDPRFAPAWARLGRMHHVMGNALGTGTSERIEQAEAALRRALDLNPDLPMAHKFLAQLDIDYGRAEAAMTRLIGRGPAVRVRSHSPDW